MKSLKYIIAGLAMVGLCACNSSNDDMPAVEQSISIKTTSTPAVVAYPGDEVEYSFLVEYESGIKTISAYLNSKLIDNSQVEYTNGEQSIEYTFRYTVQDKQAGNTLDFVLHVAGCDDATQTTEIPLYVLAKKADIQIRLPHDAPEEWDITKILTFDVNVTSSIALKRISLYKEASLIEEATKSEFAEPNSDLYNFTYTPDAVDAGQTVLFRFEVMDANGNIVTADYNVKFVRVAPVEISEFYGVSIGYNRCVSDGPFLSAATGTVYAIKDSHLHAADIDIVLFFSNSGGAGMSVTNPLTNNATIIYNAATINAMGGSADDVITAWTVRNQTLYKVVNVTAEEFAAMTTKQQLKDVFENSEAAAAELVNKLMPDSFVAFKTATGKYGVFKVISRAASNTGKVVIDYKIEK